MHIHYAKDPKSLWIWSETSWSLGHRDVWVTKPSLLLPTSLLGLCVSDQFLVKAIGTWNSSRVPCKHQYHRYFHLKKMFWVWYKTGLPFGRKLGFFLPMRASSFQPPLLMVMSHPQPSTVFLYVWIHLVTATPLKAPFCLHLLNACHIPPFTCFLSSVSHHCLPQRNVLSTPVQPMPDQ